MMIVKNLLQKKYEVVIDEKLDSKNTSKVWTLGHRNNHSQPKVTLGFGGMMFSGIVVSGFIYYGCATLYAITVLGIRRISSKNR